MSGKVHVPIIVLLSGLASPACPQSEFEPPAEPAHVIEKDGFLHALRQKKPFLCGDAADVTGEVGVPCPPDRPADNLLSCDAIGCHGGFEFSQGQTDPTRHLRGSEGPSCYSCHDDKWNEKEDEEDEEDD